MAKDPVCGMNVDEKTAKLKSEYQAKHPISVRRFVNLSLIKNLANM